MALNFDQLVTAIVSAVVEAQNQLQQTHIGELTRYFEKNGSPTLVQLQIPRTVPETGATTPPKTVSRTGAPELAKTTLETVVKESPTIAVNVPLITLINPSQLSIQEMQITMQVDMNEIAQSMEAARSQPVNKSWSIPLYKPMMASSTITAKMPGDIGTAQITIKVAADDTPEGLARLLVHLNKSL
jgi:hypothetical protein